MKFLFVVLTVFTFIGSAFSQSNDNGNKLLRHVVIFKFKDSSSEEDVKKVAATFAALYGKVPQVKAFEWGLTIVLSILMRALHTVLYSHSPLKKIWQIIS